MKVSTKDIVQIRAGTFQTFLCDTKYDCRTAQSLATYVNRFCKPDDVERYATRINYDNNVITIIALPKMNTKEEGQG